MIVCDSWKRVYIQIIEGQLEIKRKDTNIYLPNNV